MIDTLQQTLQHGTAHPQQHSIAPSPKGLAQRDGDAIVVLVEHDARPVGAQQLHVLRARGRDRQAVLLGELRIEGRGASSGGSGNTACG